MGVWGVGIFENDDATDWLDRVTDSADLSALRDALSAVVETDDPIEAPEASVALAAAEVVAALRQKPAKDLPDAIKGFLVRLSHVPQQELFLLACLAVEGVRYNSELTGLWTESDERDAWETIVDDLHRRLT